MGPSRSQFGSRNNTLAVNSYLQGNPRMKCLLQILVGVIAVILSASIGWCEQNADPQPELKTAKSVEVQYYLSLPKGWTTEKNWPILVTIDGAGHNFLGN